MANLNKERKAIKKMNQTEILEQKSTISVINIIYGLNIILKYAE